MKSKKILAVLLAVIMLLSTMTAAFSVFAASVTAAAAAEDASEEVVYTREELQEISDKYNYDLTEDQIDAILSGEKTLSETVGDKEEDVTLIVQLSSKGALDGYSASEASSSKVQKAQENIERAQNVVKSRISKKVFGGEDLDILYSYSLLTNSFAMTGKESQINEIAAIKGVESVYTAPVYEPIPTDAETFTAAENQAANYYTGSDNTTDKTGAGTVVAVIDTGLDAKYSYTVGTKTITTTFHNAFKNSVSDASISSEDIQSKWTQTKAYNRVKNLESNLQTVYNNSIYRSTKVPFAFNYGDDNWNVGHKHCKNDLDTYSNYESYGSSAYFFRYPDSTSYWEDDGQGDHGTHVSGITAGYETDSEGKVVFEGVAPDAQVLVMKVFGNDRAGNYADILAAVEDSVLLGADVINLSLGSWAGFTYAGDQPNVAAAYENAAETGVVVCAAAGNDYSSAYGTLYGTNEALASNPDNGIVSAPASYDDNLAVASVASKDYYSKVINVDGRNIAYTNNATDASRSIDKHIGTTQVYRILKDDDGNMLTGSAAEFENYGKKLNLTGKYVVVRRGQTFTQTVSLAEKAGAIGLIVCDHSDGSLVTMMENDSVNIPAIFISRADGDYLFAQESNPEASHRLSISSTTEYVVNPAEGTMNDFSSWGVTPDLKLKPEITGYGGAVYSSKAGNTYGLMSGTSMATPYVAGVSALVVQNLRDSADGSDLQQIAKAVMMSTAVPVIEKTTGAPYSPRKQGAGLVNIDAAIASKAYVTVDDSPTPKIDFGDDKGKTGVYDLTFNVVNTSEEELSFEISSTVQTEAVDIQNVSYTSGRLDLDKAAAFKATGLAYSDNAYHSRVSAVDELQDVKFMSGLPYDLTVLSTVTTDADANIITVPECGSATVTVTVTLGSDAKTYMDENFENGIYVEGFITLTSLTEGQPDLGVPYMGFYGDWTQAPMLDEGTWEDDYLGNPVHPQMSVSTGCNIYWGSMLGNFRYALGVPNTDGHESPYDVYAEGATYIKDARNVFGGEMQIEAAEIGAELGLLRSAKALKYTVTNTETGEVYATATKEYIRKSIFYSESVGMVNAGYFDSDIYKFDGKIQGTQTYIEPGTQVTYTVEAIPDYGVEDEINNARNTFSFNAYYDGEGPKVDDIKVYLDEETSDVMMDTEVSDEFFAGEISYAICGYTASGAEETVYMHTMLYPEYRGQHMFETLNLSEWARGGQLVQMRSVRVGIEDYTQKEGVNPNQCLSDTWKGDHYISFMDNVKVSCKTNVIALGSTAQIETDFTYGEKILGGAWQNGKISANNEDYGFVEDFLYESSNPEVLKISADGALIPVAPGYATITATGRYGKSTDSILIRVTDDPIQTLVEATPAGGTINYTDGDLNGISLLIEDDVTIDLGGATVGAAGGYPAIRVLGGNVTIKNGTVNAAFGNDSTNAVLVDILNDQAPALKIEGGNVTLENVTLNGAIAEYEGESIIASSAVTMEGDGNLTVKDSSLNGIYAINNAKSNGTATLISGNFEGVLGAVADMTKTVKGEGSEFIDVTNTLAEDTLSYIGTIEGGSIDYYQPVNGYYVTAEQIAAATVSTGSGIRYDAEKGCAVFSINKDKTFRKFNTQYMKITVEGLDTSKYNYCVINTNGAVADLSSQNKLALSTTTTGSACSSGQMTYQGYLTGLESAVFDIHGCANFMNKGVLGSFYLWPAFCQWAESSFNSFPDTRPKYGDMEIYGIWFYETKSDAVAFSTGTSSAYTNNLKVAGPQAYNTQFVIDGTTLNVSTTFTDSFDGSYAWNATEMSLYTRVSNGDNTYTDTLVETKAITPDESGNVNVAFTGIDPANTYVVKTGFELALTGDNKASFFHISESAAAGLVKVFPSLIYDILGVDQLEEAVTDLANFMVYGLREGAIARDARHYDFPGRASDLNKYPYIDEYPNIIYRAADQKYVTWLDYWDNGTLQRLIGYYNEESDYSQPYPWPKIQVFYGNAILFANILGDAAIADIYAGMADVYPESVLNKLVPEFYAAQYGCTGTIPAFRAQLAALRAAATGETAAEQLNNSMTYLANNFLPLYSSLLGVIASVYDPNGSEGSYRGATASDTLINYLRGQDLVNNYAWGQYNDNHDLFAEKIDSVFEACQFVMNAKDGLVSAMEASLYATIYGYAENCDGLMDLYFGDNAIAGGSIDLGVTATYEAEANYDGYITYELNGGVNNDANPIGYQRALPVNFYAPTKEGYAFGGWYTTADFQEGTEIAATNAETSGDLILYAKWNVNAYYMTFMLGDTVVDTVVYTYGQATAPTDQLNVASGKTFKYWYENDSTKAYTFGTMPAHDVTLYAQLGYMSLDDFNKDGSTYVWPKGDAALRLTVDKSCTIDFDGKVISNMNDLAIIEIKNGANVTIKNATFAPAAYLNTSAENYTILVDDRSTLTLENCIVKGAETVTPSGSYASCSAIKLKNGTLNMTNCVVTGLYAVDNTKYSDVLVTPTVNYGIGIYAGLISPFAANNNITTKDSTGVDVSSLVGDAAAAEKVGSRVIVAAPNFDVNNFTYEYQPYTDELTVTTVDSDQFAMVDGSTFIYNAKDALMDGNAYALTDNQTVITVTEGNHSFRIAYDLAVNLDDAIAGFIYGLDDAAAAAASTEISAFNALLPKYDSMITRWNNNKDTIMQKFAQYADNALLAGYLKEMREAVDNINGTGSKQGIMPKLQAKLNAYKALTTDADRMAWLLENKAEVIALTIDLDDNAQVIANDCLYLNALAEVYFGVDYSDKLSQVFEIRDEVYEIRISAEKQPSSLAADYAAASDKNAFVASLMSGATPYAGEATIAGSMNIGSLCPIASAKTLRISKTDPIFDYPEIITFLQNALLSEYSFAGNGYSKIRWETPNTQLKDLGTFAVNAIYTPDPSEKMSEEGDDISVLNEVHFTIDVEVIAPATYCDRHGHDFAASVTVEPTCTTAGQTTRTCNMCGYVDVVETYKQLGHVDDDNNNICDRCKEYINDTGKSGVNFLLGALNYISNFLRGILQLLTKSSGSSGSSSILSGLNGGSDSSSGSVFSSENFLVKLLRWLFNSI